MNDDCLKLTTYFGERDRTGDRFLADALLDIYGQHEVEVSLLLRGAAGFGVDGTAHGARQRAKFFGRNADVGDGHRIARVLPELGGLLRRPLATLERVRVCKRDGARLAEPHPLPGTDEHGLALWQKLMVFGSEQARHERRPLHQELVRRLRAGRSSGATTLRGIWGFHGDHEPHGDRLLQIRRHVPTVTIIVDRTDRIMDAFAIVDELTDEGGLVTSEMVPASAALAGGMTRGGLRLARHRY